MSDMIELVDSLENKVSKLLHKLEVYRQAQQSLSGELEAARQQIDRLEQEVTRWEERYHSLKLANSMLGSSESKTEAKLKINTLIREIDLCIAQLSE